jgi:hypothetical protein
MNINKPTVNNAMEKYYQLKNEYESKMQQNNKIILKNDELSKKEKRSEFLKMKPKCIHCNRVGGTIFSSKYLSSNGCRELKAICGVVADPCNLNITIQIGIVNTLPNLIKENLDTIFLTKDNIINNKNKLLFGFLSTQQAIEDFEDDKEMINNSTALYELYLKKYSSMIDESKNKDELIEKSYELIEQIKECVQNFNKSSNKEYISDAVEIQETLLKPVLKEIQQTTYQECYVGYNEKTKTYHLIQNKISQESLEHSNDKSVVIEYNVKPFTNNKGTNNKGTNNKDTNNKDTNNQIQLELEPKAKAKAKKPIIKKKLQIEK